MYSDVFCRIYDLFGWNYYPEAFAEQLLLWLRQNKIKPKNCLDMACGTGILCRELEKAGIPSAGADLSEGMVKIAKQNAPGIPFYVGDMCSFRPEKSFQLITCTGDAVNHLPDIEHVSAFFKNVHEVLEAGGYFVFDMLDPREISDDEPFEMDYDEHIHVWLQMTRPEENLVDLCVRVNEDGKADFEEHIRERLFPADKIIRLLLSSGFKLLKLGDTLPEDQAGHGNTVYVAAQKE